MSDEKPNGYNMEEDLEEALLFGNKEGNELINNVNKPENFKLKRILICVTLGIICFCNVGLFIYYAARYSFEEMINSFSSGNSKFFIDEIFMMIILVLSLSIII